MWFYYSPDWKLSSRSYPSRDAAKRALTVCIAMARDPGFGRRGAAEMRKSQGSRGGVFRAGSAAEARLKLKSLRQNFRGITTMVG
jgi:hypothetical protein